MLRGIRLVIYDLDGTLIDSNEAIVEVFNRVVVELGEKELPRAVVEEMIGLPYNEAFRRVLPEAKHSMIPWCWERYREIYAEFAPGKTRILPGVEMALAHFKMLGLKQSVATLKHSDVASKILERLGLLSYFDLVLGITDVTNPKPASDVIDLTLTRLQVDPREAVFVEDTTIGLEAGKKAGVYTVGVTTGTDDRERLAVLSPDYIVDGLRELTHLILP
jgi:HAD superfamily hydrolase (TIGR01509 family)